MKNTAMLSMLLASAGMFGCNDGNKADVPAAQVPAAVIATFNGRYPDAAETRWEMKKLNDRSVYEAEFKVNNNEKEAKIEENGTFIGEEDD
jgi:uncharacterized membrane protein YkoI